MTSTRKLAVFVNSGVTQERTTLGETWRRRIHVNGKKTRQKLPTERNILRSKRQRKGVVRKKRCSRLIAVILFANEREVS